MLCIYPVPGTVFCVFHEPSNLIFPAPSSCSPLSLHLFGLGWGITKIIRIKGCNAKARQTLTAPPTCYTVVAGSSRPKEQLSCDQGVSPSVNLPESLHLPIAFLSFQFSFSFLWQKWNWQAWHLNAYSSTISIVQARNMGEAAHTSLISRLETTEQRCGRF